MTLWEALMFVPAFLTSPGLVMIVGVAATFGGVVAAGSAISDPEPSSWLWWVSLIGGVLAVWFGIGMCAWATSSPNPFTWVAR